MNLVVVFAMNFGSLGRAPRFRQDASTQRDIFKILPIKRATIGTTPTSGPRWARKGHLSPRYAYDVHDPLEPQSPKQLKSLKSRSKMGSPKNSKVAQT
eukprot:4155071-Amphidinium_carterae.1